MDSKQSVVFKYPVCDAGQQFIRACLRTAGNLELTAEERFTVHCRMNPPTILSVCDASANVLPIKAIAPSRKQFVESQSA